MMSEFLGLGMYSVPEASLLTKVPARRIRRWVKGYSFTTRSGTRWSEPVWNPQIEGTAEVLLTFKDLIEIRFVNAYLLSGVRWNTLRRSAERFREEFHVTHPFSTRKVLIAGNKLFAQVVETRGRKAVLNLSDGQYALKKIIEPLLHGVDFKNDQAERWWPLGERRRIVIDPHRSFGRPIDSRSSVPTRVLFAAYKAEESFQRVARWYGAEVQSVKYAVQYETSLAA